MKGEKTKYEITAKEVTSDKICAIISGIRLQRAYPMKEWPIQSELKRKIAIKDNRKNRLVNNKRYLLILDLQKKRKNRATTMLKKTGSQIKSTI